MKKRNLIEKIARETKIGAKDTEKVIDSLVKIIVENFKDGETTAINGFGKFVRAEKKGYTKKASLPYMVDNPNKYSNDVVIPDRTTLAFRPSKRLRQEVVK